MKEIVAMNENRATTEPDEAPTPQQPAPGGPIGGHAAAGEPSASTPLETRLPDSPLPSAAGPAQVSVLQPIVPDHSQGFKEELIPEEAIDRRLAEIEMIGEEVAAGWKPQAHTSLSPEVRYLHVSRTIHQLVTDRNRSVGIFLAVASILVAAATGLLNVKQEVTPIIPLRTIQYWCLPVTFGTLAVLAIFISVLLIRARIGLIYEVAKLNTLLGLHSKRVEKVNPLSIFYVMHLLVVVLGGVSAGFTAAMVAYDWLIDGVVGVNVDLAQRVGPPGFEYDPSMPDRGAFTGSTTGAAGPIGIGLATALLFILGLQTLYYVTILRNTTDAKLDAARS
jgi:hypothetical protein